MRVRFKNVLSLSLSGVIGLSLLLILIPQSSQSAILSRSIGAGSDDANVCEDADDSCTYKFSNSANYLILGSTTSPRSSGNYHQTWLRFDNITLAEDTDVTAAVIAFKGYATTSSGSPPFRVFCIDQNDTATFSSDPSARPLTTNNASWTITGGWVAKGTYYTSDLESPVQEVIDESYWESGEAMGFKIQTNTISYPAYRTAYSYDGDSNEAAVLTLTYSTAVPEFSTYTLFLTILLSVFAIFLVRRYSLVKLPVRRGDG